MVGGEAKAAAATGAHSGADSASAEQREQSSQSPATDISMLWRLKPILVIKSQHSSPIEHTERCSGINNSRKVSSYCNLIMLSELEPNNSELEPNNAELEPNSAELVRT